MSTYDRPVESPNRLVDVADPCTEMFYPRWSSCGMRAVRCTRPAKKTLYYMYDESHRRVCGTHARRYAGDDRYVIEGGTA